MLLTRLPLGIATSFDLHVLGTPPALILSQDQTLRKIFEEPSIWLYFADLTGNLNEADGLKLIRSGVLPLRA